MPKYNMANRIMREFPNHKFIMEGVVHDSPEHCKHEVTEIRRKRNGYCNGYAQQCLHCGEKALNFIAFDNLTKPLSEYVDWDWSLRRRWRQEAARWYRDARALRRLAKESIGCEKMALGSRLHGNPDSHSIRATNAVELSTLDRTDMQLMLCEQIKNMDMDELIALTKQLWEETLEVVDEEEELVAGTINQLEVDEPDNFSMWLSFLHSELSERLGVESQRFASRN